jgi:MFS family permease
MQPSRFLKPAILSLSFLSVLSGVAVSPALGQIRLAFPEASDLAIQLVLTLPPLLVIPVSLFSGALALIFKRRQMLFVGLVIYILGGLGGGLVDSLPLLLVTRALLGIGNGVVAPLSLSLIADFYTGEERAKTMGLSSAMATLSGVVMPLISGWLAVYDWHYAFASYLISLPVCALVWFYLPEPPVTEKSTGGIGKLPGVVYAMGFLTFLLMVVFYLIPARAALFLMETGIGNSSQSGLVIAALNVSAFLVGLWFGSLRSLLKRFTNLFGILMLASGLGILFISQSLPMVIAAMFIAGLGIGTLMPTIFLVTANRVPASMNATALSIINSSLYLGQFASPLVFAAIASIFQTEGVRYYFLSGALMTAAAAVVVLFGTYKFPGFAKLKN